MERSNITIKVSNLSESTTEADLEELLEQFGPIQKLYFAKDEQTGHCNGFAYINFTFRNDAARAITMLNKHFFLVADWSRLPAEFALAVKCRTCNGDHWTSKCPCTYIASIGGAKPGGADDKSWTPLIIHTAIGGAPSSVGGDSNKPKHVPPNLREGASKRTDNPNMQRRDDASAIRVSNLSEATTETDLEDLVRQFGPIQKLYLAYDRQTRHCKGFAYIHFKFRNDAVKAITALNGHVYDNLILIVDWSKPPVHTS